MTISKRSKVSRQRGTHTHGWGAKKKHRGAGSRGGRGLAGSGKRGDANKPANWHSKYFGKHGFSRPNSLDIKPINIKTIVDTIGTLEKSGHATKKGDSYRIDLGAMGINKLLGTGVVKLKLDIKVDYASQKAIEKIESAGGKVDVLAGTAATESGRDAKAEE